MNATSAQALTSTHDCLTPGCAGEAKAAIGEFAYCADCRIRRNSARGVEALDRMDAGEPQQPASDPAPADEVEEPEVGALGGGEPHEGEQPSGSTLVDSQPAEATESSPPPSVRAGRTPRYEGLGDVVAEIQRWAAEHDGIPPSSRDLPSAKHAAKRFNLTWPDLIVEAGFERPKRGKPRAGLVIAPRRKRSGGKGVGKKAETSAGERGVLHSPPADKPAATGPAPEPAQPRKRAGGTRAPKPPATPPGGASPASPDLLDALIEAEEQLEIAAQAWDQAVRAYHAAIHQS